MNCTSAPAQGEGDEAAAAGGEAEEDEDLMVDLSLKKKKKKKKVHHARTHAASATSCGACAHKQLVCLWPLQSVAPESH